MPANPPTDPRYASAGVLRRQVRILVTSRPLAWLAALLLPGLDRAAFRLTRGRVTFSAWVTGLPVVQLTTIGARSSAPRTARVLGIPDAGGFIVVAANFGQTANPAWYYNLRARPQAWIVADGVAVEYRARELTGLERDQGFQRAISLNPGWRRFQKRARPRAIPVMRLTRVGAENLRPCARR